MEEIKNKMYCVKKGEAGYPKRLLELAGMPEKLYFYGRLPDDEKPSIAIVGARMCSSYGRIQSFSYGKFVSRAVLRLELIQKDIKGHLRGIRPPLRFLEAGLMCVIRLQISDCMTGF